MSTNSELSPLSEYSRESFGSNSTRKRKRPQVKNESDVSSLSESSPKRKGAKLKQLRLRLIRGHFYNFDYGPKSIENAIYVGTRELDYNSNQIFSAFTFETVKPEIRLFLLTKIRNLKHLDDKQPDTDNIPKDLYPFAGGGGNGISLTKRKRKRKTGRKYIKKINKTQKTTFRKRSK